MNGFKEALDKKTILYNRNNFSKDNYDEFRFGPQATFYKPPTGLWISIKNRIKKIIGYTKHISLLQLDTDLLNKLNRIHGSLNDQGKSLLVDLVLYRELGLDKVKLARNNPEYWKAIELAKTLSDRNDTYDPHFMHFILEKFDLKPIGYDVKLYFSDVAIAIDYILEQYAYKLNNKTVIGVEQGDVVLDIGACWGDTALYFASKSGEAGKVYSFEFIPDNLKLFKINKSLNPLLSERIEIVERPVSKESNQHVYFKDFGPGSEVVTHPFEGQTGSTTTISIDDFVKKYNVTKVDFIKMDIEGAEPYALQGAIETIKTFKPKLAIAIYHSMDDMVNIPNWILDLNLGYEIFIDHFTIHSEETICFAKVKTA